MPTKGLFYSAIFVSFLVLLAGCGGIVGQSDSVSDVRTDVVEETPVLVFDYSVNDYSTVLLEGPDGRVINRGTLEPNKSVDGFVFRDPEPGDYKIIVRRGEETVVEESVTFEGADPVITGAEAKWSGNTLEGVSVTIENRGDLPVRINNATISARGSTVESGPRYQWVKANNSREVTISPAYNAIKITEPGEVRGSITVLTPGAALRSEFRKTFDGANLTISDTSSSWSGDTLNRVTVSVKNSGDLPAVADASIYRGEQNLASDVKKDIPAGATAQYEITDFSHIYKADSGGDIELSLVINSSSGFTETTLRHYVEPANLSVEGVSPDWDGGDLRSVAYSVRNSGDVTVDFSVEITVAGEIVGETSGSVEGHSSKDFEYGDSVYTPGELYSVESGGSYPVTITVSTTRQTTSQTESKEFADIDGSIGNIETTFYEQYDSSDYDLSTLSFSVRNDGEIGIVYDKIEISIGGVTRTESLIFEESLRPGSSTTEHIVLSEEITVSSGQQDLEIRLMNGGDVVLRGFATVSTS